MTFSRRSTRGMPFFIMSTTRKIQILFPYLHFYLIFSTTDKTKLSQTKLQQVCQLKRQLLSSSYTYCHICLIHLHCIFCLLFLCVVLCVFQYSVAVLYSTWLCIVSLTSCMNDVGRPVLTHVRIHTHNL